MNIGIDVHSIGSRAGGNETYYRQLVAGLARSGSQHQFTLYHTRRLALTDELDSRFQTSWLRPANPFLRIPVVLPLQLRSARHDVFHAQYILPPGCTSRTVLTVHDLAHEHIPESFRSGEARRSRWLVPWSVRRADQIITVSRFSADDISRTYGVLPERITVAPLAASQEFRPLDRVQCKEQLARVYNICGQFILYVGRVQARKNLPLLLEAFQQLRRAGAEHLLVIVGPHDYAAERFLMKVRELGLESSVIITGYVPGLELPLFYNAAEVFVFPSVFEGFGLPVIEAMACGTPVITSFGTALEEVAGNAALLVEPCSLTALVESLRSLLQSESLRAQLRQNGLRQSASFDRDLLPTGVLRAYEEAVGRERTKVPALS